MSRPADWAPLGDTDPVPGDPVAVASLGAAMRATAERIAEDVLFLRSVCTAAVWDSEAGDAFRAKAGQVASKLYRTHARYAVTAEVLGTSLHGPGYAARLHEAQSMAGRALAGAQEAWPRMTSLLSLVMRLAPDEDPYGGVTGTALLGGLSFGPVLQANGSPQLMEYSATDKPEVAAAKRSYNQWAQDLSSAAALLREAEQLRDEAAASAAARIESVIASDGLQNPGGWAALWDRAVDGLDDAGRWWADNWQRITADIANVLSWIATAAGLLAMVFAFICPTLAMALEALALGLNAVCLVLNTILAATGYSSWLSVGTDVLGIVSDGLGAGALGGIKATMEAAGVAEGVEEGVAATTEASTDAEAEGAGFAVSDSSNDADNATEAKIDTDISEGRNGLGHRSYRQGSGFFGKLPKESLQELTPQSMARNFKTVWEDSLSEGKWRSLVTEASEDGSSHLAIGKTLGTLRSAAGQAFTLHSAEIAEEAEKLDDPETIAQLTRLARTQYRFDIAHYTQLWDVSKVLDLGSDGLDKLNQVTEFMGGHLPGYGNLEEAMKTGGSGG